MATRKLQLGLIDREAKTQARVRMDRGFVDELIHAVQNGRKLPPLDVFSDGEGYWLGDGWHRFDALVAHYGETRSVDVNLHQGGLREAMLFAAAANKDHGLRRTIEDKRRAVGIVISDPEWSGWSNRQIADHCGVNHELVQSVRDDLAAERKAAGVGAGQLAEPPTETEPETRIGRDGKRYPVKRKAAGGGAGQLAEPPTETAASEGRSIEELAVPYRRALTALSDIKSTFEAISLDPEAGGYMSLKFERLRQVLDEARGIIRQQEPIDVCPRCSGDGCKKCAQTGFRSRFVAEGDKQREAAP